MELLAFGDTGWGDELFRATLMTIAVSITAMLIGFSFAAAKLKPINIAVIDTAIVIRVARNNSSPQPVSPNARSSIQTGDYT